MSMLAELPDDMGGCAVTPAGAHLFAVDDAAQRLDKNGAELFHSTTAKNIVFVQEGASRCSDRCRVLVHTGAEPRR